MRALHIPETRSRPTLMLLLSLLPRSPEPDNLIPCLHLQTNKLVFTIPHKTGNHYIKILISRNYMGCLSQQQHLRSSPGSASRPYYPDGQRRAERYLPPFQIPPGTSTSYATALSVFPTSSAFPDCLPGFS